MVVVIISLLLSSLASSTADAPTSQIIARKGRKTKGNTDVAKCIFQCNEFFMSQFMTQAVKAPKSHI